MNAKTIIEDKTTETHYALEKALAAEMKDLVLRLNAERPESEPWFWPKHWGFEFNYWLSDQVKSLEIYLKFDGRIKVKTGPHHDADVMTFNDENAGIRVANAIGAVEQLYWKSVSRGTNESLTIEDFREFVRTIEDELTQLQVRLSKEFGEAVTSSRSIGAYNASVSLWPPNSWEDVTVTVGRLPPALEITTGKQGDRAVFDDRDPGIRLAKALGFVETELRRLNYHEDVKYP